MNKYVFLFLPQRLILIFIHFRVCFSTFSLQCMKNKTFSPHFSIEMSQQFFCGCTSTDDNNVTLSQSCETVVKGGVRGAKSSTSRIYMTHTHVVGTLVHVRVRSTRVRNGR